MWSGDMRGNVWAETWGRKRILDISVGDSSPTERTESHWRKLGCLKYGSKNKPVWLGLSEWDKKQNTHTFKR